MNTKVIESIAGALKLNVEELTKVLTSENEVDFKLPENLRVLTNEELDTIKDNHGKERYDAGKIAGDEMRLKNLSKEVGFEESITDGAKFIDAYKNKILNEAKIEPNKKIQELTDSITTLQGKLGDKDNEISTIKSQYETKERQLQAKSFIPELPENIGLTKDEATSLFLMSHEIKEDGVYKNGQKLKDSYEAPLSIEQSVSNFVQEKKWTVAKPSGRGGGARGQGGGGEKLTLADYESALEEKGLNPGSAEANALLQDMAKTNPEILNVS